MTTMPRTRPAMSSRLSVATSRRPVTANQREFSYACARLRAGALESSSAGAGRVERDRVAEEEQQDERQHEGDEERGRVAQDLQRLLHEHRMHAAQREVHAASRDRSDSSIRAMKASSRVGSLRSLRAAATRALSSSGVPVAIWVAR